MILPRLRENVALELDALEREYNATTLDTARAWLEERINGGAACPCCGQHAELYRRGLTSTMARDLVRMDRRHGTGQAFHARRELGHPGDFGKLRFWGLVVELDGAREDGGRHGYWRITRDGARFVSGDLYVARYVWVYANRAVRQDGPLIGITDALGGRFDLRELRGQPNPPTRVHAGQTTIDEHLS